MCIKEDNHRAWDVRDVFYAVDELRPTDLQDITSDKQINDSIQGKMVRHYTILRNLQV